MLVNFNDILPKAAQNHYAIAGFNIFSIDWARACVYAAEELKKPVILMTNKAMVNHYPIAWLGQFLGDIAKNSTIPVCIHLDHCTDFSVIEAAIQSGYSSVMYDGSFLPLDENIRNSQKMADLAHQYECSIECELGTVAYTDMPNTQTNYTSTDDVQKFINQVDTDALAVSIGTTHRSAIKNAVIQYDRLQEIEDITAVPLVIHGTSGVHYQDLLKLKRTQVAKFNIGTDLRLAYADQMRETLNKTDIFDPLELNQQACSAVQQSAKNAISLLGGGKI